MQSRKIVVAAGIALLLALAGLAVRRYRAANASDGSGATGTAERAHRRGVESPVALGMREPAAPRDVDPKGTLRLEGQVIDEQDLPVAGAEVVLDASPAVLMRSGKDGAFLFEHLMARDYRVEARTDEGHAGPVELSLTPSSDPVILRMRRAGALDLVVRDAVTNAPVAGAAIELRSALTWQARSDAEGRAHLTGVGAGWPTLHVAAAGYAPAAILLRTSGDPERAQKQIVSLVRGAAVDGRVVDFDNKPVAGARVIAVAAAEPFPVVDATRDAVVSAADGNWHIAAVAAGSFRFIALHPDFAPGSTPPLVLDGEHAQGGVTIRVTRGAALHGRVVDENARPIVAALVRLVGRGSVSWRLTREAYSDGEGRFALRGLPERAVDLSATSREGSSELAHLDLAGGADREVTLVIAIHGTIEGLVVAPDGHAIAEARVLVEPQWSGALGEREAWEARGLSSTLADGGGQFRFTGLPAGKYLVRGARPGASDDALWLAHSVAAASGDRDLRIIVPADGRVRGQVAFKDGTAPDLFTVEIGAVRPEPISSSGGRFDLAAPGGRYDVVIAGPTFQQTRVPDVVIKESATTDLGTITVETGRSVAGRVLDANGTAVSGALVAGGLLLTGNGSDLNIPSEGFHVQEAQSDESGRYLLRGFGEDPIIVVAERDRVGRSASVRIPRGPTSVELDLVLQPTGSLAGTVTRDGQPLPETVVIANPRGARRSNFFVLTGSDGSYAFDTLSAGEYVVFPMLGGGGIKPKDMFFEAVTVTPGHRTTADLAARYGSASVSVKVITDQGDPVGVAQLFVVAAKVSAPTPTMEAMREGAWLLEDGQIVAAYLRNAIAGAPARIDGVFPGPYTFCAVPLPIDPNDPAAMLAIRDVIESLPMQCVAATVEDRRDQSIEVRVPHALTKR